MSASQATTRGHMERPALQVGVVVVVLEGKERGVWPRARVVRLEESRDGLVRKVQILLKGHTVRRAVNGLVKLQSYGESTEAADESLAEATHGNEEEA